jgi:hypothetical protein
MDETTKMEFQCALRPGWDEEGESWKIWSLRHVEMQQV